MVDLAAEFLRALREPARAAEEAEALAHADFRARSGELAGARRAANRRLRLLRGVVEAIDYSASPEAAEAAGRKALEAALGLDPGDPGRAALLQRFDPVARAIDAAINFEGEPDFADAMKALAEFETWRESDTGRPRPGEPGADPPAR